MSNHGSLSSARVGDYHVNIKIKSFRVVSMTSPSNFNFFLRKVKDYSTLHQTENKYSD